MKEPYVTVQDRFGARALVYLSSNNLHRVVYHDDRGNQFFTEEFDNIPIESVEQYAIDWAKGKRELT